MVACQKFFVIFTIMEGDRLTVSAAVYFQEKAHAIKSCGGFRKELLPTHKDSVLVSPAVQICRDCWKAPHLHWWFSCHSPFSAEMKFADLPHRLWSNAVQQGKSRKKPQNGMASNKSDRRGAKINGGSFQGLSYRLSSSLCKR